jgi:ABC-type uncharacterized transport system substrate-binding protein
MTHSMLDRRAWLLGSLSALAAPRVAATQAPARVFRIGVLTAAPPTDPESAPLWEAFLQGLRDLGYVEGQNVVLERRFSDGQADRLPALAAELARLEVDVIVAAGGTHGAMAARRAITTIPIVMTIVRRAPHEVRARDQPEDCEGARADDPTVGAGTRGSGHPVTRVRTTLLPYPTRHILASHPE